MPRNHVKTSADAAGPSPPTAPSGPRFAPPARPPGAFRRGLPLDAAGEFG